MKIGFSASKLKKAARVYAYCFKTAWQIKPGVYPLYFVRIMGDVASKLKLLLLPKLLMDEIQLIYSSGDAASHAKNLILYAVLTVALELFSRLCAAIFKRFSADDQTVLFQHILLDAYKQYMQTDYPNTEDADILNKMNRSMQNLHRSGLVMGFFAMAYDVLIGFALILTTSLVSVFYCPILLPVEIAFLALNTLLNAKVHKKRVKLYDVFDDWDRVYRYDFSEMTDRKNAKDIRLFGCADFFGKRLRRVCDELADAYGKLMKTELPFDTMVTLAETLRSVLTYTFIGVMTLLGRLTLGEFSLCIAAYNELYQSLGKIADNVRYIFESTAYADTFLELFDLPHEMESGSLHVSDVPHVFEFKNVSFKYPRTDEYVLKNVSVRIASGERVSVVGENGAGKTTFIKLLCRLYDVTEGEILLDGVNIKQYNLDEYRALLSPVFQDYNLLAFSLKENVAMGRVNKPADDEEIIESLEKTGLFESRPDLRAALDTPIEKGFDDNASELSGGQRQMVALARTLISDASAAVLDEPTAALDPMAEESIYRSFGSIIGRKTAVFISHKLASCRFCSRILVFSNGSIVEDGSHESLMRGAGLYKSLFETQAKAYKINK